MSDSIRPMENHEDRRPSAVIEAASRSDGPQLGGAAKSLSPFAAILRVPLFYKILLANAVLVLIVAVASATVAVMQPHAASWETVFIEFLMIGVAGVLATLPIHAVVLHFALRPLDFLERTAEKVEAGDLTARAAESPLADPQMTRLTSVFNRSLSRIESDRQRLRDVAAHAFNAQEAERVRIARDLEEETAQALSALLIRLRVARQTPDTERREELLDEIREAIVQITEQIRRFARSVHSPELADLGVAAALEALVRALGDESPVRIRVDAQDVRGQVSEFGQLAIYRIVQEAISNGIRHSGAENINVRLAVHDSWVEATVQDDGAGFDVRAAESSPNSLGLLGMQERALYAGGELAIESRPGEGTTVRLRIPIESSSGASARGWFDVPEPDELPRHSAASL